MTDIVTIANGARRDMIGICRFDWSSAPWVVVLATQIFACGEDRAPAVDVDSGLSCFAFDPTTLFAVPVTFSETTPRWERPDYDESMPSCPASALTAGEFPFEVQAYCNEEEEMLTVGIELNVDEEASDALDDPLLVLYSGIGVPNDPRRCLAINDDASPFGVFKSSEVRDVELAPGAAITVVATVPAFDPAMEIGTGSFQVVSGPQALLDEGIE